MGRAYLAESFEDGIALRAGWDIRHAVHLLNVGCAGGDDVYEAIDDIREGSLTNSNQRSVHDSDALCWALKRLALLGERLDVFDNLSGRALRNDGSRKSQS